MFHGNLMHIKSKEAPYADNFLCENWSCKIFPTTFFSTTSPFVRQFFQQHDRLCDSFSDDMTVCATSPFVWQFIQPQARLCDNLSNDKPICETVFCATRRLCDNGYLQRKLQSYAYVYFLVRATRRKRRSYAYGYLCRKRRSNANI